MWERGQTASQIADELGGVSRNAVIGKAHRLGLQVAPLAGQARTSPKPKPRRRRPETGRGAAPPRQGARRPRPVAPPSRAPAPRRPPAEGEPVAADARPAARPPRDRRSIGPGGFIRQGPGDQQAPIPPAPPRRLVPAKPSPEIADKTSLLDLNDRICKWPIGHPGEPDFHFCGDAGQPGLPLLRRALRRRLSGATAPPRRAGRPRRCPSVGRAFGEALWAGV